MTIGMASPAASKAAAPVGPPPSTMAARPSAPKLSGRPVWSPWREAIYNRAARLQAGLDRLGAGKDSPDYHTVGVSITEALTAARYLRTHASAGRRAWSWLTGWLSAGNQSDRAWMAIHRGEEALVMIADAPTLRAEALRVFPAAIKLGASLPLIVAYVDVVSRLAPGVKLPPNTGGTIGG